MKPSQKPDNAAQARQVHFVDATFYFIGLGKLTGQYDGDYIQNLNLGESVYVLKENPEAEQSRMAVYHEASGSFYVSEDDFEDSLPEMFSKLPIAEDMKLRVGLYVAAYEHSADYLHYAGREYAEQFFEAEETDDVESSDPCYFAIARSVPGNSWAVDSQTGVATVLGSKAEIASCYGTDVRSGQSFSNLSEVYNLQEGRDEDSLVIGTTHMPPAKTKAAASKSKPAAKAK